MKKKVAEKVYFSLTLTCGWDFNRTISLSFFFKMYFVLLKIKKTFQKDEIMTAFSWFFLVFLCFSWLFFGTFSVLSIRSQGNSCIPTLTIPRPIIWLIFFTSPLSCKSCHGLTPGVRSKVLYFLTFL